MGALKYKGYSGTVEYSKEDNYLFGKLIGMNKNVITYEGKTIEELKADFEAGVGLYLKRCMDNGVSRPSVINIQMHLPILQSFSTWNLKFET